MDNRICVIVPTYNRPLQLQCFLESFSHCLPADAPPVDLLVLHRGCKTLYEQVIRESAKRFNRTHLKVESTFYKDFVGALSNPYYRYIMLCTDDTIFVNDIPLTEGLQVLSDHPEVVAYSLRLSSNTTLCYMHKHKMDPPEFRPVAGAQNSATYRYKDAKQPGMDYEYWCDISSTIYRQSDLVHIVSRLDMFHNSTTFEACMNRWRDHERDGLAFQNKRPLLACSATKSFAFSNPKPTHVVEARAVRSYSNEFLMQAYRDGKRIDIQPFMDINPNAVHMDKSLRFKSI